MSIAPGQTPITLEDFVDSGYWYRKQNRGRYPTQDTHTPEQEAAFIRGYNKAQREIELQMERDLDDTE